MLLSPADVGFEADDVGVDLGEKKLVKELCCGLPAGIVSKRAWCGKHSSPVVFDSVSRGVRGVLRVLCCEFVQA